MQSSTSRARLAVIGSGAIADSFHLPALSRHPDVLAQSLLIDPAVDRARTLAEKFGVPKTCARLEDVLGEVDGAIVAVPARFHHAVARQCLEAGVHVLCEKPLCENAADAADLVAIANSRGAALAVNQTRRLFPSSREIRDRILAGELGDLVEIEYLHGEPFDWPAASDSYFGARSGGKGVLLDTGAHIVDLVCFWLGGAPELTDYHDDSYGGTEAVADLDVQYGEARAHIRLSWLSKLRNAFRVRGSRGAVEGGSYEWGSYTLTDGRGATRKVQTAEKVRTFDDLAAKLIDNFIAVVRDGAEPIVPGHEVLASIETIEACYARRTRFDAPWHDAYRRIRDVV